MDRPLVTLGNLREHIKFTRHIPVEKQRFVCQGRSYNLPHGGWHTATDDVPLDTVLGEEPEDHITQMKKSQLVWFTRMKWRRNDKNMRKRVRSSASFHSGPIRPSLDSGSTATNTTTISM